MATHEELGGLLERYETLTAEERVRFDEHVRECVICAARLAIRQAAVQEESSGNPAPAPPRRRPLFLVPLLAGIIAAVLLLVPAAGRSLGFRSPFVPPLAPAPTSMAEVPAPPPRPKALPLPTPSPSVYPPDALAWLQAHADPLRNLQPGASPSDLAPLSQAVGSRRVLIVNDSSFGGASEALELQQRLLELLVAREGPVPVTVLAEVPWPEGAAVERYVQEVIGEPEALMLSPAGVQTQESLYTLRWLRAHYRRVHILGFLPPVGYSRLALQIVNDYFLVVDPESLSDAAGDKLRLVERLAARRDSYISNTSVEQYNRARQAAQVLLQSDQLAATRDPEAYAALYQRFTLANLQRLLPTLGPGPVLVWLQGYALSDHDIRLDLIGYLRSYYGRQAVFVTAAYYEGNLYRKDASNGGSPQAAYGVLQPVPPAQPGSWEAYWHEAGLPAFALDLGQGRLDPLPAWLRQLHPARTRAPSAGDCHPELAFQPVALGSEADLVVFFDRVRPAAPLGKLPAAEPVGCSSSPGSTVSPVPTQ